MDKNQGKLREEALILAEYNRRACKCWLLVILVVVFTVFICKYLTTFFLMVMVLWVYILTILISRPIEINAYRVPNIRRRYSLELSRVGFPCFFPIPVYSVSLMLNKLTCK